jgi:hypothetical protein
VSVLRGSLDDVTGKLRSCHAEGARATVLYCNIVSRDKTLDADRLFSELKALQAQCRPLHYNRLWVLFKPLLGTLQQLKASRI